MFIKYDWLPQIVGSVTSETPRLMLGRSASAVAVHHTKRHAGRQSHNKRRREEMHDCRDLSFAIVICHHYAAVHSTIMARELCALVTQFPSEVPAVDGRRISATLDVYQEHRLDVVLVIAAWILFIFITPHDFRSARINNEFSDLHTNINIPKETFPPNFLTTFKFKFFVITFFTSV